MHQNLKGSLFDSKNPFPAIPNAVTLAIFTLGNDEFLPPTVIACSYNNYTLITCPSNDAFRGLWSSIVCC
ncbi:hypothetical protein EYC84_008243 [Monilinia fructicola]|uniref:Uncharacterized protein n=1 Tax=Monilinia fructicola TaxID=38448 RepID=A0A5M9JDW0_MONFR|nr:hypothetical protein EYC84_008243 [Monilinia fructicola]